MGVGFIRDKLEIKFLILYIAARVSEPLPLEGMQELTMCDDGIDYFDFSECLNDLVQTEHLRLTEEGRYAITPKGLKNSAICESSLPYSVRLRTDRNIEEYNKELLRQAQVQGKAIPRENGTYTVSRPFNVATKGELTNEAAQDFMNYIMSEEGQAIVAEDYIPVSGVEPFESNGASGTVTVSGSSSVSPLMQKLIEGYNTVNPNVEIELQTSDSTTGMTDAINGMSDIGMASRELKQEELDAGLVNTVIATDGIAIIVNNESPITDLTTEQVRDIYLGNITDWSELG